jgi:4-amino-4-deoxy-L-arabinose transferase-like glycosyltransferase
LRSLSPKLFWPVTLGLLACLCAVQAGSILQESVSADEPVELAAGYSYLKTGDYRLNREHPPLAKLIAALPLLAFPLHFPADPTDWNKADGYSFGYYFLETNERYEDALLFAARCTSIATTLALGLAIALWGRVGFGPGPALLALALYCFDPTVIAHGRYVKNDLPLALWAFLACIAWGAFLEHPRRRSLLLAGAMLGLAIATKYSALFLLPVFALLYLVRFWQGHRELPLFRGAVSMAAAAGVACAVVGLAYAIPACIAAKSLDGVPSTSEVLSSLLALGAHAAAGHPGYLFGKVSQTGWWYYFPIAFAVKTPAATLVFLAVAAWTGVRHIRKWPFAWFVLAAPLAVYGALSLASRIDIGVRHLLPMYPFLFLLAAAAFRGSRALTAILVVALIAQSAAIYPHYLAFFNVLAGGPKNGPKILADSNIDWGQDAKKLASWRRAHPDVPYCLEYWGNAGIARFGANGPTLAQKWEIDRRVSFDCFTAVSVNYLYGLSAAQIDYEWLREIEPDLRIGYSIYLYDLPRRARERRVPVLASPAFRGALHQDLRGEPTVRDPARPGEILACT